MGHESSRRSTPARDFPAYYDPYGSPSTTTPSPYGPYSFGTPPYAAHARAASYSRPATAFQSPRFHSDGTYGTVSDANVSAKRRHSSSKGSRSTPKHERRSSYSYSHYRVPPGDSDEDEYFEIDGVTYKLPARSTSRRYKEQDYYTVDPRYGTDFRYHTQAPPSSYYYVAKEKSAPSPRREEPVRRPSTRTHSRRNSTSTHTAYVPSRSQTVKPTSSTPKKPAPPPATRKATSADAKRHRIPEGYSLKNWDPSEEPIILLGSVFDANSLGKWIYDWTVHRQGAGSPIGDMAGELWLLLIQLSGKIKRAEQTAPIIRNQDLREMVEDFIESGERLTDKLRALLKKCEAPMLQAQTDPAFLGLKSGERFVDTLFGRDRELDRTDRFMQSIRTWNLRFDQNVEAVLQNPKQ